MLCAAYPEPATPPGGIRDGRSGAAQENIPMASLDSSLDRWRPEALAVLRIMTALLFLSHGLSKLFGIPQTFSPEAFSLPWIAGMLELVGGVMILIGFMTRPVAFILSGLMAVAYFMAHAPQGFFPILNGGELAILYCFVFLYFVFSGAGAWSVDGARTAPGRLAYR
jgi:putative oxidoreductase